MMFEIKGLKAYVRHRRKNTVTGGRSRMIRTLSKKEDKCKTISIKLNLLPDQ